MRTSVAVALVLLAGCSTEMSLDHQRQSACIHRARFGAGDAGFDLEKAADTGEMASGGMASVYFRTRSGSGGTTRRMATCTFAKGSAEVGEFVVVDAGD